MKEKFEKILGIIFLIWFVGSIVALFYFSQINGYYALMVFGQYFVVFGIIPLFSKAKGKLIGIPFILVGLACIIIPLLMLHPELLSFNIDWNYVIPLLFMSVFIIVGLVLILVPILIKNKLKKVCTVTVFATIKDYDVSYDDGKKLYCPIYSFEFNNEKYEFLGKIYSNINLKPIGTVLNLNINPNNPNQFLENNKNNKFFIIFGILTLIVCIPIFIYLLTSF